MEITSTLTASSGDVYAVRYQDVESEQEWGDRNMQGVHAFCFHGDQLVVVYAAEKECWTPPGGRIEEGEGVRDAARREVREETNMNVLKQRLLGFQDIFQPDRTVSQARVVCLVEPLGDFVGDPDGDIAEIRLIDPKEYKKYFDWGEVGDHLMRRALEMKVQMDAESAFTTGA